MKKWIIGTVSTLLVVPCLVFGRDQIKKVWAAPQDINRVEKKVDDLSGVVMAQGVLIKQSSETLRDISYRQEKAEAVQTAQIDVLKEMYRDMRK